MDGMFNTADVDVDWQPVVGGFESAFLPILRAGNARSTMTTYKGVEGVGFTGAGIPLINGGFRPPCDRPDRSW